MPEEQERHGHRESDTPAGNEDGDAIEPAPSPTGESAPRTPAPSPLRPPQRHIVWRWHIRRRQRKR
ncbi:MAG: hypothetical protein SNJ69_15370 [Chloroflexaceae bacterium]